MSAEWHEVRVGDLVAQGALAISDGYRVRNEELGPDGIPFVRGGDIQDGWINTDTHDHIRPEYADRVRAKLTQPDDIAFITKGTVGRAGRLRQGERHVIFAPQVSYWRVTNLAVLDPGFLYYLVLGRAFQDSLNGVKTHGSMVADYVSISQQHDFKVLLPGIRSQQAIAYILGSLDNKIELNRTMNTTLEAIVQELFRSCFVDFEPVRAKASGLASGLPKHLADLFPNSFGASELGEIPAGWKVAPIGELATIVGGSTPSTKESLFWNEGVHHWATPKDLSNLWEPVLLDTERRITDLGLAQIGSGLLPVGAVLLSSRAPIGYLAIVEIPVAINQGFIAMNPRDGVSNLFLLSWARCAHGQIVSRANGTTFLEISKSAFRPIPVICPPFQTLAMFEKIVRPLYSRIVVNVRESVTLRALRDTLLPRLIAGELPIRDAERIIARRV
jgi:type I restriction enzyme, S subunit